MPCSSSCSTPTSTAICAAARAWSRACTKEINRRRSRARQCAHRRRHRHHAPLQPDPHAVLPGSAGPGAQTGRSTRSRPARSCAGPAIPCFVTPAAPRCRPLTNPAPTDCSAGESRRYEYRHRQEPHGRDEPARHARRVRQSARRCHPRSNQLQRVHRYRCCRPRPTTARSARPATRIKAAKFTLRPAFEDIDFTASRSISKAADQGTLQPAVAARCASGAADRPNRRRQDLHRPGGRPACLRVRQVGAVHDA